MNRCNTVLAPSTEDECCLWVPFDGAECAGSTALLVNGTGVQPVPLPISLLFTAQEVNKQFSLAWKTASEANNKDFEIQRSKDGINWNKIGFVNGILTSSHEKNIISLILFHFRVKTFTGCGNMIWMGSQLFIFGKC